MVNKEIKKLLDSAYKRYNRPEFIPNDPIVIPHMFSKKQDIEIMGFIAAVLAWGQRSTIVNKCKELALRMDNAPYDFILNHSDADLKRLLGFKHRTFNDTDLLYFISYFHQFYKSNTSLEDGFVSGKVYKAQNVELALNSFHLQFCKGEDFPERTRKHIASPSRNSACKRLNMFLRWMVRKDDKGVDFGIWNKIAPSQLICPCDVHVERVARKLGLVQRTQMDWHTAVELTNNLKEMDPKDPVKYDFALFGLGIEEKF